MSDGHDESPSDKQTLIGYGRPPALHRFKPGVSGNPNGRPRKPKPAKIDMRFGMAPTNDLVLAEAYRPVVVREGEKLIELPAIQAVLRSMGVAAMKGNRFAQKALTEIVQKTEAEHQALRQELFESACHYKWRWEPEFKRCEEQGIPPPDILPHPDDVVIDINSGTATVRGPMTPEDKARWDKALSHRDALIDQIGYFKKRNRRARTPQHMLDAPDELQKQVDHMNSTLPKRYRKGSAFRIMNAD